MVLGLGREGQESTDERHDFGITIVLSCRFILPRHERPLLAGKNSF